MKKSIVTIADAFEVGFIEGEKAILAELLELAIVVDPNLNAYIKARMATVNDKYKMLRRLNIHLVPDSED